MFKGLVQQLILTRVSQLYILFKRIEKIFLFFKPSPTGFQPVREYSNGFQVHRLNHSATMTS